MASRTFLARATLVPPQSEGTTGGHKLTKRTVDALKPRAERYDVYDSDLPGFAVRVAPSGTKSFAIWYGPAKGVERRAVA